MNKKIRYIRKYNNEQRVSEKYIFVIIVNGIIIKKIEWNN